MASQILRQWWTGSSQTQLLNSEHRLLSALVKAPFRKPFHSEDAASVPYHLNWVEFRAHKHSLPTLPTVVLAHGFGSGLGFFYRNIDDLLQSGQVGRVVGVDWLGMGASSRVSCRESPIRSILSPSKSSKISFCNSKFTTNDAINFFLNPLHNFLTDKALFHQQEDIWFVGHSLGGYLAAKYAMRMAQMPNQSGISGPNLKKLILASPVGFQPGPSTNERISRSSLPPAIRIVDALWSSNFTPQSIVRLMGSSRGRSAIKRTLHGRIPHLKSSEIDLLAEYLYHITVSPASGEYAMNSLLEPAASKDGAGVYARQPLGQSKMAVALKEGANKHQLASIKVLYGDHDWMRFNEDAARKECESIKTIAQVPADVHIIEKAGHHLYLDNADSFVEHIINQN